MKGDPLYNALPSGSDDPTPEDGGRQGGDDPPLESGRDGGAFELTEDGIARVFTAEHGSLVRFVQEAGKWLRWDRDDQRWVWDDRNLVREWLRRLIRSMSEGEKASLLAKIRKSATITGAEGMARNDPMHSTLRGDLDTNKMLLGCPGVTVELETGDRATLGSGSAGRPASGQARRAVLRLAQ